MTEKTILALAKNEGFEAEIISTNELVFDFSFRAYCEENLCGNFGKNYTCPPDCAGAEEMKERILSHRRALVLKSEHNIPDYKDAEKVRRAQATHNQKTARLYSALFAEKSSLVVGCGACALCTPCKKALSEPCTHPDLALPCLSAFCIDVKRLAESCNMQYVWKDKRLSLFGMIAF